MLILKLVCSGYLHNNNVLCYPPFCKPHERRRFVGGFYWRENGNPIVPSIDKAWLVDNYFDHSCFACNSANGVLFGYSEI